jgi:hypothetical protein
MKVGRMGKIAAMVVLVPLGIATVCGATMLLWNALMPAVFKLPALSFWQAAGVLLLARLLFGGRGGRFGVGRHRWRERMQSLTPEERERLRSGLCGDRMRGDEPSTSA